MTQSDLYNGGGDTTDTTDVVSDDARDLGDVDVKTVQEALDIVDDSARKLGQTQVTNSVALADQAGNQVDPFDAADIGQLDGSTATAGATESLDLGRHRKDADAFVDVSGAATLTVEVSTDGVTWRQFATISYDAANTEVEQFNTSYRHIRVSVDANLNTLELVSRGG